MAKQVVLTPSLMKRIAKYIEEGYGKEAIATKIGIARQTLFRWEQKNKELKRLIIESQLMRSEQYKDEIITIADDKSRDTLIDPETGREYPNATAVTRAAVQIKARKDVMKYDNPEKFGEKSHLDITSNGESVSGFVGLVIKPPKEDEDEE